MGLRFFHCFGLVYGFLGWFSWVTVFTVFLSLFDLGFLELGLGKEKIFISRESKTKSIHTY